MASPGILRPLARVGQRLYVRIWLAVVLAVAVLTLLLGWAWRMAAEPPLREIVLRNAAGEVIGNGVRRPRNAARAHAAAKHRAAPASSPNTSASGDEDDSPGRDPEFVVSTHDGQTLNVHLPRPARSFWNRPPFGFFWTLGLVGVAVALATYPIIRKLTRRLELLQRGVEQWGAGDLAARVSVHGQDEVAFLAQRFNHAAERIEALVLAHKSLLANASHELRSPLTRIRLGLELMAPSPPAGLGVGAAEPGFKTEILRNLAELEQLIDEILLASRLDAQAADLGTVESIDLTGLAAEECARLDAQLDSGANHQPIELPGIAKLLRRAIRNLLENARRYSQGDIEVLLQSQDGWAWVQVCDHGPGVAVAQRERIFEPFYRAPGASERDGGVGLGLALVRSIALRHSGRVRCTERPDGGVGACFILELPLQPPSTA